MNADNPEITDLETDLNGRKLKVSLNGKLISTITPVTALSHVSLNARERMILLVIDDETGARRGLSLKF